MFNQENLSSQLALPFFYTDNFNSSQKAILLDEDTSRHVVQVLRMKKGELLNLTDGKGHLLTTEITGEHKKHCEVVVTEMQFVPSPIRKISIGLSLIKNNSRFEWFLEKATETGVDEIIPLICERTEKQKFRGDRLKNIVISAMLQSQQCWLPVLHEPVQFKTAVENAKQQQKFIGHCIEEEKQNLPDVINEAMSSQLILIGPEGDFSKSEIDFALQHHFIPVALGNTRLRTETAGIAAAVLLKIVKK